MKNDRISRRSLLKGAGAGLGAAALAGGPLGATARAGLVDTGNVTSAPLKLARVWATNAAQRATLGTFDDTHLVFDDNSIEVLLWPGDLERLVASGLRHKITVKDVIAHEQKLAAQAPARSSSLATQPGERTAYRKLADYNADLVSLNQRFPDRTKLFKLPEKSLEGRDIYGIEIASNAARKDGRPVFYMDGVHHAREWPAGEMPIMWAHDLLESYGSDPRVTSLVDKVRFIVVPIMNPDGFTHSRDAVIDNANTGGVAGGQEAYWRKNRRSVTGVTVPVAQKNPDAYGTDPNRNYAYAWGDNIGGSSSDMTTQTYRGDAPFSEPESRNISWVLRSNHATAMITNHTNGNLILRAWGDTYDDPVDDVLLKELGDAMASFNGYKSQKSIQLYATTGTCSDYAYGVFGSLGYTFEHDGSQFHPAYASAIPAMYAKNRRAYLLLAEAAANAAYHGVIAGRLVDQSGSPAAGTVRLYKQFETLLWHNGDGGNPTGNASKTEVVDTILETNPDGTFEYHVNPSTRPYLQYEGVTETYELTAKGASGAGTVLDVAVLRGEKVQLGDIRLP